MHKKEVVAYFDCYSGISGDMTLGSLIDCGLELDRLRQLLALVELDGYELKVERVTSYGLCGTRIVVQVCRPDDKCRHLPDIEKLIQESGLPEPVKEKSIMVFRSLACAESKVHGISVNKVHFHEVGAVDSIVDIIGSVAALYLLGVEKLYCSAFPIGGGMVQTSHGHIPLPAPATLEMFRERLVPVYGKDTEQELVTPTGAALMCTLCSRFGSPPAFTVEKVGYGAGTLDPGYPNYLRVIIGTKKQPWISKNKHGNEKKDHNSDEVKLKT